MFYVTLQSLLSFLSPLLKSEASTGSGAWTMVYIKLYNSALLSVSSRVSLQSNEFLHLYFSSVSPPSSADADLSPAEEEISSPAADLKSDNKSDDESDDTPSV